MVTEVVEQKEARTISLEEVSEALGIKIRVRPWWGSRRQGLTRVHKECGRSTFQDWNGWWCPTCGHRTQEKDTELRQIFRRGWICPGGERGGNGNRAKWPELQSNSLVLWQGPCRSRWGERYHKHCQELQVLDYSIEDKAFLLRIATGTTAKPSFLIGFDDGHLYITHVRTRLTKVQDAFDWLLPNIVREAKVLGLDVKRQGDWHFIPAKKEPRISKYPEVEYGGRPVTSKLYRNKELVYGVETRHRASQVVYKSVLGLPYPASYVKGKVSAPNHPPLKLKEWHIGVRNRQQQSNSRDGKAVFD